MQQGLYEAAFSGRAVKRGGNRHAHIAASGALKCQDGYVVVSANERRMWQQLVELVGDDRLRDPALNDERVRMARQAEIFGVLETWAGRFTKAELSEMAQSRGIPIAPVHDVDDLLEDPHLRARRFFHRINGHDVPALMTPWSIPGVDGIHHGADAAGILRDAGFASEEIARLESAGIVSCGVGSRARDGAPVP
jgi:formyl-CoA transferase